MQKKLLNLYRQILSDRNTRNLSFFLLINLAFAFVELTYGLLTNSLGLISDSFHMFFDCSALLLGLAASIVAKWKQNDKFTYGFGRAEVLAGLANGLFLLFIALFIMKEAIERTFEPPEVHHERLFVISFLGFIVNLIGIFVFQHGGQAHHHIGGSTCSHSSPKKPVVITQKNQPEYQYDNVHGYTHYSSPTIISDPQRMRNPSGEAVALDMNGYNKYPGAYDTTNDTNSFPPHTHNHSHAHDNHHHHQRQHDHDHQHHHHEQDLFIDDGHIQKRPNSHHRGQIMQSVLLHVIADTLGSIGVMISALLMNQFGWMIADPICSLFIAILISISVYPLLRDSFYILMQRIPVEIEATLPENLYKIQNLAGVLGVHDAHFWTLNSDTYVGCLKLVVKSDADLVFVKSTTHKLLRQMGIEMINIQIDFH